MELSEEEKMDIFFKALKEFREYFSLKDMFSKVPKDKWISFVERLKRQYN